MGETNYFWAAWAENDEGDTREINMQGDDIRDYTVTEASHADILEACGVAGDDTLNVERNYDGRAYIFDADGKQLFAIESTEICGNCGYALEGCEGECGPEDAPDVA